MGHSKLCSPLLCKEETVCERPVNASKIVLSPRSLAASVKQVRDAKLTPQYTFITDTVAVLHRAWHSVDFVSVS